MSSFRQLMMRNKGGGGDIPAQYTVVDYIKNTDSQYIDTGISAPNGFIGELIARVDTYSSRGYFVGAHNLNSPYGRSGISFDLEHNNNHRIGLQTGDYFPDSYFVPELNQYYRYNFSTVKGNCYLNVNDVSYLNYNNTGIRSSLNLLMFTNNYGVANNEFFKCSIKYLKIFDSSSVLIAEYFPVFDTITQKYGMYDTVTKTFLGNQGSGDFSGGND